MTLWHVFRIKTENDCFLKYLSVQFSHSVVSDSLPPHGLQYAKASSIFAACYLPLLGSANVCLKQD